MKYIKSIILTTLLASGALLAPAAPVMISNKLDSTTMMMGSVAPLHIEVVQDKEAKGEFPLFKDIAERGYATLLNDTVEISAASRPDTVEIGSGRIQINCEMLVQVFDSGYYRIPGIVYVSGGDTVAGKDMFLKVKPVNVTANDKISPMTDVQEPEEKSIFDALPDWLVDWWWVILLLLAVAVATVWGVKRYRRQGSLLPPKPEDPPHVVALERLKRLKARKLWESGMEKEYYTVLTDILRLYLEKRFGIKAMEMTSRQIMETLTDDTSLRGSKPMMRQVLDMADFVKFAKVRPLPDDNVKAFDNAVKFVEETAPRPEADDEDHDDASETGKPNVSVEIKKAEIKKGGER